MGRPKQFTSAEAAERLRLRMRKRYNKSRLAIIKFLGGKCSCGFADPRALQVDHRNGGGLKAFKTGDWNWLQYHKKIMADPTNYQLLCANCNWIKRAERNENPIKS